MKYFILLLSMASLSCAQQTNKTEVVTTKEATHVAAKQEAVISKVVSPEEFKNIIAKENVQLIDVRTPEEYSAGNINAAKNINFYDGDFKEKMNTLNKDLPLAIYCRSGGRSGKAAKMLKQMGFKEVYDLKDGYNLWSKTMK